MNENNIQNNQTNVEKNQENVQDMRKTVINGKIVPLSQAEQLNEQSGQANQTGIQPHHDNSTESVPAGQMPQNQEGLQQAQPEQYIKPSNVQSGQSHLSQAQGQQSQAQVHAHQTIQNDIDEKAKAKAKAKKDNQ